MKRVIIAVLSLICGLLARAQSGPTSTSAISAGSAAPNSPNAPGSYLLGPDDQISLVVDQLQDDFADKTFRIDQDGDLSLPLIGRVHAGGLSQAELEDEVRLRLSAILKEPDIVVNVTEYSSQPVSVLGAVNTPGIKQLQGGKTLFDVLSMAGGLRPDAGTTLKITRELKWGAIPVPDATVSTSGQYSVATVHTRDVMKASEENIVVRPGDTVFVPRADVVYIVGAITKPGGFPIGENESLSTLQLVALAEGIVKTAAADKARILRRVPGASSRAEIPVDLKALLAGKASDTPLLPDDILFVPGSAAKSAGYRTLDAIVNAATGMAMYGRY